MENASYNKTKENINRNSENIKIIDKEEFKYASKIHEINIKEKNDLDIIIKEQNDPDKIINEKGSSNKVTKEQNDFDMIIKQQ
jgi:hypothetical protein